MLLSYCRWLCLILAYYYCNEKLVFNFNCAVFRAIVIFSITIMQCGVNLHITLNALYFGQLLLISCIVARRCLYLTVIMLYFGLLVDGL